MRTRRSMGLMMSLLVLMAAVGMGVRTAASAETGRLRVTVRPVESDVFIDGLHMGDATWDGTLTIPHISPGEHTVLVTNYGYAAQSFKVNFEAGKTMGLKVVLQPEGAAVSGPWGEIEVRGSHRAALLLNGKTPEYSVAHGGLTRGRFSSRTVVPPGNYQAAVVHGDKTIWSGPVTVEAGKRVVINAEHGTTSTENWRGKEVANDSPRFHGGLFSSTVAVGPTTGSLTAGAGQIDCGGSTQLTWSSTGAVHTDISGVGDVAASGQQQVSPTATTTYTLTASGPGGVATVPVTVTVNNAINANLEVAPAEISYERVGSKVKTQGSATVTWSATTGTAPVTVTVDPFGSVDATGSRQVQPTPQQTGNGPVNETITYTLHATNACGGDATRTATLHLTGSIKPGGAEVSEVESSEVALALVSIYFSTDWPTKEHPEGGLLKSQQEELTKLAGVFKTYQEHDPNARLALEAHADVRASSSHNQELTERRAARVKDFLVSQGVSASSIDTTAVGKESQLGKDEVKQIEAQNPNTPPKARLKAEDTDWMAYNRRVDIVLQPLGIHSTRNYPHQAADSSVLWEKRKPTWKVIEKNQ
jgi:outer membrane protein OmpA-like peptidoglycan-associated protein